MHLHIRAQPLLLLRLLRPPAQVPGGPPPPTLPSPGPAAADQQVPLLQGPPPDQLQVPLGGTLYSLQGFVQSWYPRYPRAAKLAVLGGFTTGSACSSGPLGQKVDYLQTGVHTLEFEYRMYYTGELRLWRGKATSLPTAKTLTMEMYRVVAAVDIHQAGPTPGCTAEFQLVSGALLGMSKNATSCPAGLQRKPCGPHLKACISCGPGNVFKGSKCIKCPKDTFAPAYTSTSCKPCPAGQTGEGRSFEDRDDGAASCVACSGPIDSKGRCKY